MPNTSIENESNVLAAPLNLAKIHVGAWHEGGTPEDARINMGVVLSAGLSATIQSLKSMIGSFDGQIVGTRGYYAAGDCEPLIYVWSAASTATDDGVDSTHPGLVIQPTGVSGAGRWVASVARDVNVKWYGAKGDNVQDDIAYIQRAIDRAIAGTSSGSLDCAEVVMPVGIYKTSNTIHLGYGTDYSHVTLRGADSRPGRHVWGVQLRPTFTDRPVVNFQGARTSSIDGIAIIGTLATTTLGNAAQSAWDAVVGSNLNKQFVGIAVDAYSGADPGTGYTNAPSGWNKNHSSDVRINNCQVTQCAHGVAVKPSGGSGYDNNGDYVVVGGSCFDSCKFAFSINGSQARINRMVGCVVADCFAAVGTGVIGAGGVGQEVNLMQTMVERTNYFVYHNAGDWSPQIKILDCGGEGAGAVVWAVNSTNCVISIERNTVNFYIGNDAAFEHRTHIDVGLCNLRLVNNRFTIQNSNGTITRRAFIVRCPSTSVVSGNVVDVISGWAGLFRVPPRATATAKAGVAIGNSQEYQVLPCNDGAVLSAFYNLSATSGRQYSGQATSTFLRSGVMANDYVSFTTTGAECYLFKVISVAGYTDGSVVVLEQINETTSTTPISTAAAITQVTSSSRYALVHRPDTGSVQAPESLMQSNTDRNYTIADSGSVNINPANGAVQVWVLGANRTPTATSFKAGQKVRLMINDGASAFAVTWSSIGVVWIGGSAPTLPTGGYAVVDLWKVGTVVYGEHVGDVA